MPDGTVATGISPLLAHRCFHEATVSIESVALLFSQIIVDGAPQVLPVEGGELTLPSVVAYKPDGRILVGRAAQR